jgi:NTE family protein
VSANLTTGRAKVHRAGRVSDALRASIALPGILPPVITPDGVLADGAVIDNLPVAVMRGMHRGVVVAVDVARDLALDPEWLRREVSQSPLGRLLRPPIIPILMRAGTISSDEQNRRQSELADLIIQPPLGDIDLRDWKAFDRTVEIGYRHTREVLAGTPDALKTHLRVPAV